MKKLGFDLVRERAKFLAITLAVIAIAVMSTPLGATPLAPGATVIPAAAATFGTAGGETLVISSVGAGGPNFGNVASFWWTAVYRGGTGALCPTCLSFYYQVRNDGTTIVNRETDFVFGGFVTDVFITPGAFDIFVAGTQAADSADREASGNTVGFNFGAVGSGTIDPGEVSFVKIIRTNATDFTSGGSSIIDGGTSNRVTFQPTPEPSSIVLLGVGLLGVVATFGRLRRSDA